MNRTALVVAMILAVTPIRSAHPQDSVRRMARGTPPVTMQASALARLAGEMAGYRVMVPNSRILWVVDGHTLVVESDSTFNPTWHDRNRVVVMVERGRTLAIPRPPVAIAPVTIAGVARTLLGMQAGHDVPWAASLTPRELDRLDIRAAILASSVRTADGVELTVAATP